MEKNKNIKENGITLIALVITVVILIILAFTTTSVVIGEGGLIERAKLAKEMTEEAAKKEEEELNNLYEQMLDYTNKEDEFEQQTDLTIPELEISGMIKILINWDDVGNEDKRPDSLIVQLIQADEVYSNITLSKESSWIYIDNNLEGIYDVYVPNIPKDYKLSWQKNGMTIILTFTYRENIKEEEEITDTKTTINILDDHNELLDGDGVVLSFYLEKECLNKVIDDITVLETTVEVDLPVGTYYIKVGGRVPDGYNQRTDIIEFTVEENKKNTLGIIFPAYVAHPEAGSLPKYEKIEAGEKNKIEIRVFDKKQSSYLTDWKVKVYNIGTLNSDKVSFSVNDEIKEISGISNLTYGDKDNSENAKWLANRIQVNNMEALAEISEANGTATIDGLEDGMYLVVFSKIPDGYESPEAILLPMPALIVGLNNGIRVNFQY